MRYRRNDNQAEYPSYAGITRIRFKGPEAAIRLASQPDMRPAPLLFDLFCGHCKVYTKRRRFVNT